VAEKAQKSLTDRRRRWRELMRQDLLEAAVELIRRDGLEALTVERVADACGVAKGTVYLYFENKRRLVEQAVERLVEPLVTEVTSLLETRELPPETRLRWMAEANLQYFDDNRGLFRVFVHGRFDNRTRAGRTRTPHYRTILEKTARVVAEGSASGELRPFDPETVAAIWMEAVTAVILRRLMSADPPSRATDLDLLIELFFGGLRAPAAG
jgi:AcrR family transcriptional regulator